MVDESDVKWQAVDCHPGKAIFNMIKSHNVKLEIHLE